MHKDPGFERSSGCNAIEVNLRVKKNISRHRANHQAFCKLSSLDELEKFERK